MSDRDEADVSFADVFRSKFGASVNTAERLKAERRAGRTPKERSRNSKGPPRTVQINVRGTVRTKQLLEQLATLLGGSQADVIEAAVERLAKDHTLGDPPCASQR